jgi:hypothetical protein
MSIVTQKTTQAARATDYEYPALCIPRALGETTQQEMRDIIHKLGLGEIYKIVIKPKEFVLPKWEMTTTTTTTTTTPTTPTTTTTPTTPTPSTPSTPSTPPPPQIVSYNNIYIYFKRWNTENPQVRKYRDNIIKGQTIKIVHKMIPTPIFWRCVAANFTTYNHNHHHQNKDYDPPKLNKK